MTLAHNRSVGVVYSRGNPGGWSMAGSRCCKFKTAWLAVVAGTLVASVVGSASAGTVSARAELAARPGPWTFEGKADLHDSGALELKVRSAAGVPRAFDLVRRLLIGRDVLLVNTRVPIVDTNGRAVALNRLNDAILRVKGTLLPAGQWRYDLDGEATPTVRVSRIVVLSLEPPG
jgi:hypothetical protein